MADNIIDDMLKNQVPKKKKGSGVAIFFLIVMLILVIGAGAYAFWYYKEKNKVTPKEEFLSYLGNVNFSNVLNLEKNKVLSNRLVNESSDISTEITGDVPASLIDNEKFDISKLKLKLDLKNNPIELKNSTDVNLTYNDDEIVSMNVLANSEEIGLYIKDVIVKYIGCEYVHLPELFSEIYDMSLDFDTDLIDLNSKEIVLPNFQKEMFAKYVDIINQKIPEDLFNKKEITLDRTTGKVNVNEYSISLTEEQLLELVKIFGQTLENDDVLLDTIIRPILGDETDSFKEELKVDFDYYLNKLYDITPDNSRIYTFKIYGENNITYKISVDIYGEYSFDIDFDYSNNENSMTITVLENKSQNGFEFNFVKKSSDVTEELKITVNLIKDSEIVGKVELLSDLVNSGNSYTLKNSFDVNYMFINVTIQANSQINFKNVEIKDLDESTLFLDTLNEEQLDDTLNIIKLKFVEVIEEKMVNLGIIEERERMIEVPEEEPNKQPPATINTSEVKEAAKNKLISSISQAMTEAVEQGKTYTLIDLMTLEIPDSTFSVSLEGDIAILNIDGFEFKLNSDFQLYE